MVKGAIRRVTAAARGRAPRGAARGATLSRYRVTAPARTVRRSRREPGRRGAPPSRACAPRRARAAAARLRLVGARADPRTGARVRPGMHVVRRRRRARTVRRVARAPTAGTAPWTRPSAAAGGGSAAGVASADARARVVEGVANASHFWLTSPVAGPTATSTAARGDAPVGAVVLHDLAHKVHGARAPPRPRPQVADRRRTPATRSARPAGG